MNKLTVFVPPPPLAAALKRGSIVRSTYAQMADTAFLVGHFMVGDTVLWTAQSLRDGSVQIVSKTPFDPTPSAVVEEFKRCGLVLAPSGTKINIEVA